MAKIFIDGNEYEVDDQANVLEAVLSLGLNLPYFCWHPALGSAGACRQCAVKQFRDENDTAGRLVMGCMTPVANGARYAIEDPEARDFRAGIVELLMTNHPHDCPVCDEGGECHLQDMTLMTGHNYRKYSFKKRTYVNQYLGPFINHEMNRCIQCYRCVRFYRDHAGGRDFNVFGSKNTLYFGRQEEGVLENEFSGNLVEVCPTGVFTDKTLKQHFTRRWDLQMAPSVCVHCGVGCNTTPGERYGGLRRVRNRYNGEVNGYFLCDRGRYGYEFVNHPKRVTRAVCSRDGQALTMSKPDVVDHVAGLLKSARNCIGIGSPRASLESNFALLELVGEKNFFLGLPKQELELTRAMLDILRRGPARSPSLREMGEADAVLILGEDLTNTAPMMALALRQSVRRQPLREARKMGIPEWNDLALREVVQDRKGPLFIAAPHATKLDDIATRPYRATADDIARLGFAVTKAIDGEAPGAALPEELQTLAQEIADTLRGAEKPLVIAGPSCGSRAIIEAAANVAWALCRRDRPALLSYVAPECNTFGAAMLTANPLEGAFEAVESGASDTVIIIENDLYRRANRGRVDQFFAKSRHTILLAHTHHSSVNKADVLLPAETFAEGDGTLVNNEGRAQRFFQVYPPESDVQESWRWIGDISVAAGRRAEDAPDNFDSTLATLAARFPEFARILDILPRSEFRVPGLRIPRQMHRYSGRTAMRAHINVSEGKVHEEEDSTLAYSMEGSLHHVPPALMPSFWAPGWNSVQAISKFQEEIGGPLRGGDPGSRLIEADPAARPAYFNTVPEAFAPRAENYFALPMYHIFGSDELSMLSPPVIERAPKPYVAMAPADAGALGLAAGGTALVEIGGETRTVPVKIHRDMPAGAIGLAVGLPGVDFSELPAWATVRKAAQS